MNYKEIAQKANDRFYSKVAETGELPETFKVSKVEFAALHATCMLDFIPDSYINQSNSSFKYTFNGSELIVDCNKGG